MFVCRFEQTGYTVKRIEPSLDKSCLLVYISTVDSTTVTASAAASKAAPAGALLIYQVTSSKLSIY
mgnify:CR=1 FL=1